MKKILILEGLGCANCASKIEQQTKLLSGVEDACVDFVLKRLSVEVREENGFTGILDGVKVIVSKIEPDVKVVVLHQTGNKVVAHSSEDEGEARRTQVIKLVTGGVLFLGALLFSLPDWLELVMYVVSYSIVGFGVVRRAVKGIVHGQVFSEHFLMSVATIGAFAIGEYPEGVAVMIFYLVGELFQDMAVDHSRKSITALMDIRPDYANLKQGDELKRVSPEAVHIGDIIVVKPGEKIPLDGRVLDGISLVDTAALTGEAVPRELEPGQEALSGFVNKSGVLTIEVTKAYGESTVSKILDMVQNASSKKAPTENFLTKFASYYTPIVVFAALALALIPPLVIQGATFSEWIYRALIFLVVSCPCALVISIPLGFFGGIGGASKRGILVKGGNYLEALNDVEAVVFDKTGTLTKGVFIVTEIRTQSRFTKDELLEYAAYAENYSNHPIAQSIVKAYPGVIDQDKIRDYQEIAGYGISAKIGDRAVLAGNPRLMARESIEYSKAEVIGSVVHVAVDGQYAGSLVISDEVKEDASRAISALKELGVRRTVMLTGDAKDVSEKIGKQLGIDEIYSELLPADKVARFETLLAEKSKKGKIVFVGDGINDAPVLARADIGMAMGGLGSDAAIEAADIVIMTDEPSKIVTAIKVAKRTRRIVFQNIAFALGIKGIFLILGALGVATMWEAVFGDVGVTILAVLNAMRVVNTKNI